MANVFMLLLIAAGSCFSVVWLIHYLPLHKSTFGYNYSPRLILCKFLAPLDATLTLILVAGAWVGLTSAAMGINMLVYNVLTGIGISVGVVFLQKVMTVRWTREYNSIVEANETVRM